MSTPPKWPAGSTGSGRLNQESHERAEIDFWTRARQLDQAEDNFVDGLTHKMSEARVGLEKLEQFNDMFRSANIIVELGGGESWFSCIVKRQLGPDKTVIGSDIAPDAIASVAQWERVFQVRLEGGMACRSYEIPLRDSSVDLIAVFSSAHHFGAHRRTIRELARVLVPGGHALYLHEPGCRRFMHGIARHRVEAKRPIVPEDVLVFPELLELARDAGLRSHVVFSPTTTYRGPIETLYYLILSKVPVLQHFLPCCIDLVFSRP